MVTIGTNQNLGTNDNQQRCQAPPERDIEMCLRDKGFLRCCRAVLRHVFPVPLSHAIHHHPHHHRHGANVAAGVAIVESVIAPNKGGPSLTLGVLLIGLRER
jgi:hypothetical protein